MPDEKQAREEEKCTPEMLVRYFRYFRQFLREGCVHVPFARLQTKSYYNQYKKHFNKLSEVLKKYRIDPENYIRFCVLTRHVNEADEMLDIRSFKEYADDLKIKEQSKKIYEYYKKSAEYVADECIRRNIRPGEFLKELVLTKKLAFEFMCGNLSMYYLASIKNIDKICQYLDQNSRDELSIILDVHENLNQDVQDIFVKFTGRRVSPLKLSEEIMRTKQQKTTKTNN
jgi:hypothetical protein